MRAIVSARDQVEMLSPWLIEAAETPAQPTQAAQAPSSGGGGIFHPGAGVPTWGTGGIHNPYNTGSGVISTPGGSGGGGGGSAGGGGSSSGSSSSGSGGGMAGGDTAIRQKIQETMGPEFQHYNITDPKVQQHMMDQMYQQGVTESGWRNIPQQIHDVNTDKGTPAQGPLQYVPSTQQHALQLAQGAGFQPTGDPFHDQIMGVLPLEMSEGKVNPSSGFTDSSGSGVGYGHGWG